jgi:hypothetical protein
MALVVLCAGKGSLHRTNRWDRPDLRHFELWIVAYDDDDDEVGNADRVYRRKGTKWELIRHVANDILTKNPSLVWFPDDDLALDVTGVNIFFQMLTPTKKILAQPSLHPRNVSYVELVHRPGSSTDMIDVGFIEIQMPCVSNALLSQFLEFVCANSDNRSGWGLDCVWSTWPDVSKKLINSVVAIHTRPVNCTCGFYKAFAIDPVEEKARCCTLMLRNGIPNSVSYSGH